MRVRSTDGVVLEVHDLGGEGPDLLMVHGTGLHGRTWEPLARHLHGFRLWSLDARAHGDSSTPVGRGLEWEGFGDDVLAVVDHLGLDRPYGLGHSKGSVALFLAEEQRPGTFRALYCYEPALAPVAEPSPPANNPMADAARRRRADFATHDDAYRNYAEKPPFSALHPDALRAYVDHGFAPAPEGGVTLKCRPDAEAEVFEQGSATTAYRHLGVVRCPVTLALGDEGTFPAAFGRGLAEALPDARVVSFPELGHFGPFEDPERLARSVHEAFHPGPDPLS